MKRILYLLGFLVIIAAMVGIGYFFRSRSTSNTNSGGDIFSIGTLPTSPNPPVGGSGENSGGQSTPPGGAPPPGGAITSLPQNIRLVVDAEVAAFFVKDEKNVVFVGPLGKIEALRNGAREVLSGNSIDDMIRADFSADGTKVLVASGSHSSPSWSVFDVAGKSWQALPVGVKEATWAPQGSRIAYIFINGSVSELRTVDMRVKTLSPQTASSLSVEDARLRWVSGETLIIESRGSALVRGSVIAYDMATHTVKPVIMDQLGVRSVWGAGGTHSIMWQSGAQGRGGSLALMDGGGTPLYGISFMTLPEKCAFWNAPRTASSSTTSKGPPSTEIILCGVPRDASTFASHALPDDYETGALITSDDIYKIDVATGDIKTVFNEGIYRFDVKKITPMSGVAYFVNGADNKLYALKVED